MKKAPDWLRHTLYNLHLYHLQWACEKVGRHVCIYPPGHMTKREADEVFARIRAMEIKSHPYHPVEKGADGLYHRKDLDTDS